MFVNMLILIVFFCLIATLLFKGFKMQNQAKKTAEFNHLRREMMRLREKNMILECENRVCVELNRRLPELLIKRFGHDFLEYFVAKQVESLYPQDYKQALKIELAKADLARSERAQAEYNAMIARLNAVETIPAEIDDVAPEDYEWVCDVIELGGGITKKASPPRLVPKRKNDDVIDAVAIKPDKPIKKVGRPRKHMSDAEKQKAYRARKGGMVSV